MKHLQTMIGYFSFSKKERTGIFILLALIVGTLLAPAFLLKPPKAIPLQAADTAWISRLETAMAEDSNQKRGIYTSDNENMTSYQYDRTADPSRTTAVLFNFDPNTTTKEQWRQLGLRDRTIQTIQNYLNKGGHFYKPEDVKKIYGVRESDYDRLVPYIVIAKPQEAVRPESQINLQTASNSQPKSAAPSPIEINAGDKETLMRLPGIGNAFATRIINFRDKLGGFYSIQQISETYGLPDSTFQKIKTRLRADENLLRKLNINTASVEELKAHPYLRNVANVIVNYRKEHGNFSNLSQIKNTGVITDEIYNKVFHYLIIQ